MEDLGTVDCVIIGGGINGVGLARDATGRGLSVILCEKGDLGEGTSSRSGKLIHGGLRYLEYYEFRLVREALIEREVLLNAAPHIVWPMRFVLPHSPEQRPAWLIRLGLFLYDHLGGRKKLPGSRMLNLHASPEGQPIKHEFTKAFEYSDCWVDDARLVLLNALAAKERGAKILTRTEATSARRVDGLWHVAFTKQNGETLEARAKALINAAGPWVDTIINEVVGSNSKRRVKLVKGSHVIVPKFWDGPQAYVLQHTDKRLIFVNPYEGDKALIGTTDIPQETRPEDVAITQEEIDYLLASVNRYLKKPLLQADVLHTYAGVRPLYDNNAENPSAITRDYVFDVDGTPPMLSVFGGKITTYRKLAEHALQKLQPFFPNMKPGWTSSATLPGGDMPDADFERFLDSIRNQYPWLTPQLANHYARLYGTRATTLIGSAKSIDDLGLHFGHTLYAAEIDYLRKHEFAETAEDVLTRRTKHYIHLNEKQRAAVGAYTSKSIAS